MSDEVVVKVHSYGPGRALSLVFFDPISGKKKAKSAGTTNWRDAERQAGELEKELRSGQYVNPSKITWAQFRERYEQDRLATLSPAYQKSAGSAFNHLERILNPDRLRKLTTQAIDRFVAKLREEKMKDATLANNLRSIKAALRWARKKKLLAAVPDFDMPKSGDAKGRPITEEEFDRIILTIPKVRRHDAAPWERILNGLWLSGLRLGEALIVSWDQDTPFRVDLSGKYPAFKIEAKAQKGRRDETLPLTPDFGEWLLQTPEAERHGPVFPLVRTKPGQVGEPMSITKAICVIGAIGEKARVVVAKDAETGKVKYASAHDLRRSFGTRWAKRVMPAVLQKLMRHRSINTTMKYYVGIEADDVAAELWAKHPGSGNKVGNNQPQEAPTVDTAGDAKRQVTTLYGDASA